MKKYRRIMCYTVILIMILCITRFNNSNTKEIALVSNTYLTGASSSGFNDENLYQCIIDSYNDKNNSNITNEAILSDSQLATITKLVCKNKNVNDLSGLDKLTNLTELNLMENNISNIDLTSNTNIMYVELSGNPLITSIDLSKNIKLKEIYFRNNSLKNIDLSNNIDLEIIDLYSNEISKIDFTNNVNLKAVELSGNPLITSIDLSKNIKLEEIYFMNDSLKSIDLSENTALRILNIGYNELSSIDLSNNINLEYLNLESNFLASLDLSKNIKLIEITASLNSINNISLPNIDSVTKLDLHHNLITSIDVSKYINLKKLSLSANQLSEINLSNNTKIEELYISSNKLKSLDLIPLTNLISLNIIFNGDDNIVIPYPEKIINLAIESDKINNYDLSKFTNLKSLRVADYYVIPVYGTTIKSSLLSEYKSSNINYVEYGLYSSFDYRTDGYIYSQDTITANSSNKSKYTLCSTNIKDYHNTCGENVKLTDEIITDNNVTLNNISSYNGVIFYEGYREIRYITLNSAQYTINDDNSTINVEGDSDLTILENLNLSDKDATLNIDNNKLQIYYNNKLLKEFSLIRIKNPPTGSIIIYIISLVSFISIILVFLFYRMHQRKEININGR